MHQGELMPTILQTTSGIVTGLWGAAVVRSPGGKLRILKLGDVVQRGDEILTTQDGIVRLEPSETAVAAAEPKAAATPDTDLDRVIAGLDDPDSEDAPAAGLTGGDGSGLGEGYRVDRIAEGVTPAALAADAGTPAAPAPAFETAAVAP